MVPHIYLAAHFAMKQWSCQWAMLASSELALFNPASEGGQCIEQSLAIALGQ